MNESNNIIIKQSPSRESLNNLMELFNAERYEDAENLAISILRDFQLAFVEINALEGISLNYQTNYYKS